MAEDIETFIKEHKAKIAKEKDDITPRPNQVIVRIYDIASWLALPIFAVLCRPPLRGGRHSV